MNSAMAETILRRVQDRMVQAVKDNLLYGVKVPTEMTGIPAKMLAKNDMDMPESMTKPKVSLFEKL